MSPYARVHATRILLVAFGLSPFVIATTGALRFPLGFRWAPHHPPYETMSVAMYAAVAASLLIAARDLVLRCFAAAVAVPLSVPLGRGPASEPR